MSAKIRLSRACELFAGASRESPRSDVRSTSLRGWGRYPRNLTISRFTTSGASRRQKCPQRSSFLNVRCLK